MKLENCNWEVDWNDYGDFYIVCLNLWLSGWCLCCLCLLFISEFERILSNWSDCVVDLLGRILGWLVEGNDGVEYVEFENVKDLFEFLKNYFFFNFDVVGLKGVDFNKRFVFDFVFVMCFLL